MLGNRGATVVRTERVHLVVHSIIASNHERLSSSCHWRMERARMLNPARSLRPREGVGWWRAVDHHSKHIFFGDGAENTAVFRDGKIVAEHHDVAFRHRELYLRPVRGLDDVLFVVVGKAIAK